MILIGIEFHKTEGLIDNVKSQKRKEWSQEHRGYLPWKRQDTLTCSDISRWKQENQKEPETYGLYFCSKIGNEIIKMKVLRVGKAGEGIYIYLLNNLVVNHPILLMINMNVGLHFCLKSQKM